MTSLAEYNNNPGNIRPAKGVKYEGLIGVDDKGFAIFEAPKYGQQALINDITYKLGKGGIKTPNEFVNMYSPKGDENSEESRDNYKIYIAQMLGLKSTNDPFPENSVDRLSKAIANFEGGTWQKKADDEQTTEDVADTAKPKKVPQGTSEVSRSHVPEALTTAAIGTGVASGLEFYNKVGQLIPNFYNRFIGQPENPTRLASRPGLQRWLDARLTPKGSSNPTVKLPLSELERLSGGVPLKSMEEVEAALKNYIFAKEEQQVSKNMYRPVQDRSGVFEQIPNRVHSTIIPARPAADLSQYTLEDLGPLRNSIRQGASTAGNFLSAALPSVAKIGVGTLGGGLAGLKGWDFFNQYKKEGEGVWNWHIPSARNAAQGLASAGGALATVPMVGNYAQILGTALQAPDMIYQMNDADIAQNAQAVANYNKNMGNLPAQPTEEEIEQYRQMGPERNVRFGPRR